MNTVYEEKQEKKFTKTFDVSNYEILTDDGFKDLVSLHETIPYQVFELKLSNGYALDCADDHIVFDESMNEIFVKDLKPGDKVITDEGIIDVVSNEETDRIENMYDFELVEGSDRRYFTNGILSHNTELAKQIAKNLFDSEDALIRIDMSEYMDKVSTTRIQGAAAGYVGYEDSNVLDQIRRKPYSVILFDEIEKAHPDVFNLFLQMLDDGHMTDSHGRKVSFKNTVILMTSNVGTRLVKDFGTGVGFTTKSKEEKRDEEIKSILEKELKKKFAPEFINRVDDIIYFKDLDKNDLMKIIELELSKSLNRGLEIGYKLKISKNLKEHILEQGYDPQYGARPLKRSIQRWVDDYVTEYIIDNEPKEGSTLKLSYNKKDDITIIKEESLKETDD